MRKLLQIAWFMLRLVVSLAALLIAYAIFSAGLEEGKLDTAFPWGALAVFTFIAAAPWFAAIKKPSRVHGLAIIAIGLGVMSSAFTLTYSIRDCTEKVRGRILCFVENWLFEQGGQSAVTALWVTFGAFLLIIGLVFLKHMANTHNKPLEPTR